MWGDSFFEMILIALFEAVVINEIINDLDVFFDFEVVISLLPKTFRNRRDPV